MVGLCVFFCFAAVRLILDLKPEYTAYVGSFYPFLGFLGFILGDFYYKPFKPLMIAKKEI